MKLVKFKRKLDIRIFMDEGEIPYKTHSPTELSQTAYVLMLCPEIKEG